MRWEDKGYTIEPNNAGAAAHEIVPVFFFEAKKPNRGGKEKCEVLVSNTDRADCGWMTIDTSDMYRLDYMPRDYLGVGVLSDIDGKRYGTLVAAHEIGHAMGKKDEYSYKCGDIDSAVRNAQEGPYSQWYFGMPYDIDQGSMMVTNRAPRMRQLWFFVNWLNDRACHTDKLGGLLKGEQFKIVHRYANKQLNYHLPKAPKDFRDIYAPGDPAYFERNVNTGTGTVDIALYKIGQDETAYSLKVAGRASQRPWDSICVVFIKIGVEFGYDQWPGGGNNYVFRPDGTWKMWGDATGINGANVASDWLDSLASFLDSIKNRFWVEDMGAGNRYFRNTIIHFFPIALPDPFQDANGNSINLGPYTNYNISVNLNDSAAIRGRAGKALQVGNDTNVSWIVRYIMGNDDGNAAPTANTAISITDLGFLQDWLRRKLGSRILATKGA
jgi:hypothetical protein